MPPISAWFVDRVLVNTSAWAAATAEPLTELAILPFTLPGAAVTVPVAVQLRVNRIEPAIWSAVGLPPGVTINGLTGAISGAPRSPGVYPVNFFAVVGLEVAAASSTWAVAASPATLIATPPLLTLSLTGGPVAVSVTDAAGAALSGSRSRAAAASSDRPGYAVPSRSFVGGQLVVTPVAVGSGVITVEYGDQLDQEARVDIPFTVTP